MTSPFEPSGSPSSGTPGSGQPEANEKLWVLLAYVFSPVVPVIIMLMQDIKNLPYVKQHNFQALAAGVALWVIVMVLGIIPVVNCLTPILALIGWIYLIYIGVQGYNGKFVKIPILYDFVQKQGWS